MIDKSLHQAPAGLESLANEPIEIEIVDPEAVHIKAGDLEIDMEQGEDGDFNANLADEMSEGALSTLAGDLEKDISMDKNSRKEWEKAYTP